MYVYTYIYIYIYMVGLVSTIILGTPVMSAAILDPIEIGAAPNIRLKTK
jgi:hypothetical protein